MAQPNFMFSTAHQTAVEELDVVRKRLVGAEEVRTFILQYDLEKAEAKVKLTERTLDENVDRLFRACEYFGIPRIYIGVAELVGADGIWHGPFHAIWQLVEALNGAQYMSSGVGFHGGCADNDQHDIQNLAWFLPTDYANSAWETETRTPIAMQDFIKNSKRTHALYMLARRDKK